MLTDTPRHGAPHVADASRLKVTTKTSGDNAAASTAPRDALEWDRWKRVAIVVVQLVALLAMFRAFQLESRTVYHLLWLAFGGFVAHVVLPERYRLGFFGALSIASVLLVLGVKSGALLLGAGVLLIALCHVPVRFSVRVGLIAAVGVALFLVRGGVHANGIAKPVWPVLGSMFLFRLATYLYSLRHKDAPFDVRWSLAYFFMLPNVCFPLFPIIDYKTFVRTRFDSEEFAIYERGVRWMLRGLVHLLLYRIVYYDLGIGELFVNNLTDVVRHVGATFLLYLKVSGIFHLVVGLLHLYGFRLPETHRLYFLSTSFSDFWRRINIYWKDFMMKLVYYPSFFRLRRHGNRLAILAATLIVFVSTWLLHGLYFYFLQGERLFSKRDLLFWAAFAVLVLGATLWETRPGRKVAKTATGWSLSRGVATVATIGTISVLWSLWNAESITTWRYMWTVTGHASRDDVLLLSAALATAILLAGYAWGVQGVAPLPTVRDPIRGYSARAGKRVLVMLALLVLTIPGVQHAASPDVADVLANLRGIGDPLEYAAGQDVGYYEALAPEKKPHDASLWVEPRPTMTARLDTSAVFERRADFEMDGLRPNVATTWLGKPFTTNRWGMRDRDYPLEKPEHTFRIAVMGPSDAMGWGVGDNEMYAALIEPTLDSIAREHGMHAEVLNFSMSGQSLAQEVYAASNLASKFAPDLTLYVAQQFDLAFYRLEFQETLNRHMTIADTGIARIIANANLTPTMRDIDLMRALRPVQEALDNRVFQWAAQVGYQTGAQPVVLMVKLPEHRGSGTHDTIRRAAQNAGLPVFECANVFDGLRRADYSVSPADRHPNAAGHQLIARCIVDQMVAHAGPLHLPFGVDRPNIAQKE